MFDIKAYRNTCDRMTLDAGKIEEMITMTENTSKKTVRRPTRMVLVAAALAAALGITASAAELPAVKEFFANVFVTVTMTDGTFAGANIPTMAVEKREERTILILDREEIDVTDALAQDGEYNYEGEGYTVRVDADGVAVLTAYSADGGSVLSFSTGPNAGEGPVAYKVVTASEVDAESDTGLYTVETDDMGGVNVIDEGGQVRNYRMEDGQFIPVE